MHATESWATALSVSTSFCETRVGCKHLQQSPIGHGIKAILSSERFFSDFRLGSSARADAPHLTPSSRDFALIESRDGQFVLRFEDHWRGWVWDSERMQTLQELQTSGAARPCSDARTLEYSIPTPSAIHLQLGALAVEIRPTGAVVKLPPRRWGAKEAPLVGYLLATAALALGALLALFEIPTAEPTLYDQTLISESRWVQIRSEASEDSGSPSLRPAFAATQPRSRRVQQEPPSSPEPKLATDIDAPARDHRHHEMARARRAGIVGVLEDMESAGFVAMAAATKFNSSIENTAAYGDLAPTDLDQRSGGWGHGMRKIGPGSGDGKNWGSVKSADYELAKGSQQGDEYLKNALDRPHEALAPAVSVGASTVIDGAIKYDVIRGQIGLRQRRFRLCFDKDASDESRPSRILLRFHISPSGVVGDAAVQEVEDQDVRACIEETLLSIRFPEPQDGKATQVQDFPLRI